MRLMPLVTAQQLGCLIFALGNDLSLENEFVRHQFTSFILRSFTILVSSIKFFLLYL